jgi:TolB-like protein
MADIFISYAREDREVVGRLAQQLEARGLTCWWDRQLSAGDRYLERTQTELDAAKAVLVVWSKHSIGSHWVADEAGVGRQGGKLTPVSLDGSEPPLGFRQFQVLDFAPWTKGNQAPFDELVASLAPPAPVTTHETPAPVAAPAPLMQRRHLLAIGAGVLVLALAAWTFSGTLARGPALEASIAVLPFENLSGDPDKDYLARGIAVEIVDKLAQLDGIDVISRNSSFTFGANADARKVGTDLKVAHVLTGTVRAEKGSINITAELIDARRGTAIWSQPYQSEFTPDGIDALQRQIAAKVSGAMSIAFNLDNSVRPSGSGTQSLEAYDFYLRGMDEWWYTDRRDLAEDLLGRALQLDPDYAEALAGLALTTASRWDSLPPAEAQRNFDEAYKMASRAVDLDPNLSVAQAVFGAISTTRREWAAAETATLQALKISRNEIALNNRQMLLLRTGRLSDAYAVMLELRQVDPLRGPDHLALINILSGIGRQDELKAILSAPAWDVGGDMELSRRVDVIAERINARNPPMSIRQGLEAIASRELGTPQGFARAVLAVFDDPAKARAVLRAWYEDQNFHDPIKWDLLPILAAWYGDTDLVLRVWRDDFVITTPRTVLIWGAAFSPARATPEFRILMKEIGLADYWRAHGWADKCRPMGDDDFVCT